MSIVRWVRRKHREASNSVAGSTTPDIDALVAQAKELLTDGDLDAASSAVRAALVAVPDDVHLLMLQARVIARTEGWEQAAAYHDQRLLNGSRRLPRNAYAHAASCNRRIQRLDRAEEVVARGLSQYPKSSRLLKEAAEIAMAREDWPSAITRWQRYAARSRAVGDQSELKQGFPVRGSAGDWFSEAWTAVVHHLTASRLIDRPAQAGFIGQLARTLKAAGLHEDALQLLAHATETFPDDLELGFLHTVAQRDLGRAPTHLPREVESASGALSSSVPQLDHDPSAGLGPLRVLRVPAGSSLELALRVGHYVDRQFLRRRVREVSTRDAWPEATSETNLLLERAHETAKRFASFWAEPPHLPEETLADAMYDAIQKELALHLPMKRLAKDIAATAGTDLVAVEIPTTEFAYLGGYTAGEFDLIYLYFELVALGCNPVFCQLAGPSDAETLEADQVFRFVPGWLTSIPRIPMRDRERHGEVALVPAGIRSIAWVAAQIPDACVIQSGRVIKEFAYDRSLRQGQPVRADVRLYPEENPLPTFTFALQSLGQLTGHDLTTAEREPVEGEILVSEPLVGTWLDWLQRATMPLLRHLSLRAQEEVETHGLREAHVADHFYPEGIIVGDAVRRAGGSVTLHPHSSNPVHVGMRRAHSFNEVHAVTRSGVDAWRTAFPDKVVHHTTEGMLQTTPDQDFRRGAPASLVLFGGRPMMGHLPILDLEAHEALYRSFFKGVEALQKDHQVNLYFKPRGLTGEHEDWLYRVVGRAAGWEPVYEHPMRLGLPNMVYASVSMGTSALFEGLSRGIPGFIVREFPVRDYTTLDAETFPILTAAAAAELVATCTTETGYRSLIQSEFDQYRDELGLKS